MNKLRVLFEDSDILIVDKPSGMPVHPSKLHQGDTLSDAVMEYLGIPGDEFVFRCRTRLDKDTSGLVLIAKNPDADRVLSAMMAEKKVIREYEAVVEDDGSLPDDGTINAPIARLSENERDIRRCVRDDGQRAVTHYRVLERMPGHARVHFILETGRTHQIRVHMAHIGHPITGDSLYNEGSCEPFSLRAVRLRLSHPLTHQEMDINVNI
ncbi:MAG: RluA family pseudouridine synthase [Eubacteriales bacterium]|nr:RluA family pseudouridine synthase [Eubacteriales bacterium]